MTTITASIVIYCTPEKNIRELLACCASIHWNSIYIVDNSPTDQLKSIIISYGVTYIHNPSNPGFGASHNLAVKNIRASDIHFILNPDITFKAEAIHHLLNFMSESPDIVCAVPKVVYPDGSLQRLCKLLPSPINLFSRRFLPSCAKWLDEDYELRWFNYDRAVEIPYVSGCFMAIRTETFKKIGGFDEQYFMYLEDIDLSRRLAQHGKVMFYPTALVIHEFAKASYKNKKLLSAHIKSAIKYFNKWGWVFDGERNQINRRAMRIIRKSIAD